MAENGLHDKMQSVYKTYHSTATSLLRVKNVILTALDKTSGVFLVLINLGAILTLLIMTFYSTS